MDTPLVPEDLEHYRAKHFDSIHSLVEKLESEAGDDHWLYRGQIRRGNMLVHPVDDGQADIEPLFPSDFRFIADRTSMPAGEVISAMREDGRNLRDNFMQWLCDRATNGDSRLDWLKPLIDHRDTMLRLQPQLLARIAPMIADPDHAPLILASFMDVGSETLRRTCWSLAQHYCLPTCLLDCTKSIRIAAWFATHHWDSGRSNPHTGEGVIYRISATKLDLVMEALSQQHYMRALEMKRLTPMDMFIFDLSEIPESAAARPSRQKGLSIYGFDRMELIQFAFYSGAVEIFTFSHGQTSIVDEECTRDWLQPTSDPFCDLVEEFQRENPGVRLNT